MKRISIFLITVALIAGMVGCGCYTPSQDLEIRDWYDLDAVRNNLRGHHILMNDLDSTTPGYEELASPTANWGKGWQPIGYGYQAGSAWFGEMFEGSFDGQGYEIRDLFIDRPEEHSTGLFGFVNEGGIIESISVINATVTSGEDVSGLVGLSEGTVRNLVGVVMPGVGSLVGYNRGTVSNSYSTGTVNGNDFVGGLVGWNDEGTVSNSYSSANVTGEERVGGLVGRNDDGTVSNSYSTGSVSGFWDVGGLVGLNNEGTVSNSFWDRVTSGMEESDGGTGKTTAEMQDITTFSGAAWDIIAVANPSTRNPSYTWNIVDDETYPFLSWQSVS